MAFSSDGKLLVPAPDGKDVKLWSTGLRALLKTLKGHIGDVHKVSSSPDGKLLASNLDDRTIRL
jgi:WD40 repeat protein